MLAGWQCAAVPTASLWKQRGMHSNDRLWQNQTVGRCCERRPVCSRNNGLTVIVSRRFGMPQHVFLRPALITLAHEVAFWDDNDSTRRARISGGWSSSQRRFRTGRSGRLFRSSFGGFGMLRTSLLHQCEDQRRAWPDLVWCPAVLEAAGQGRRLWRAALVVFIEEAPVSGLAVPGAQPEQAVVRLVRATLVLVQEPARKAS